MTGNSIDTYLTTAYSDTSDNKINVIGDWLQYGLPYQFILSDYGIKLRNPSSSVTLETSI